MERTWLNVIDEVLSTLAGESRLYTVEVECAHGVVRCILERQLAVGWLNQLVPVEEGDEDIDI